MAGRLWLRFQLMVLALRRSARGAILGLDRRRDRGDDRARLAAGASVSSGDRRQVGRNLFTGRRPCAVRMSAAGAGTPRRLDRTDVAVLRQRVPSLAAIAGSGPNLRVDSAAVAGDQRARRDPNSSTSGVSKLAATGYSTGATTANAAGLPWSARSPPVARRHGDGRRDAGHRRRAVGSSASSPRRAPGDGQNEDDQVLVPLEAARRRLYNVDWLTRLILQVEDATQMAAAQRDTRAVLRERHRLAASDADDFEVLSLLRTSEIRRRSLAFLQGLAEIFAAMTLTVGGGGVLAVTYLNVRERTAEIGLRMAVGARRRDIAALFVAEASLLSLAGGLFGLLAGSVAVAILRFAVGWQTVVDLRGVAVPFAVAVVSLVSGVTPALRRAPCRSRRCPRLESEGRGEKCGDGSQFS
jgi:hypothetical protein